MALARRFLVCCCVVALIGLVAAYTPEDLEIFDVQQKMCADSHHDDYDFYKFLRLPGGSKATMEEVEKQYRKLSRMWHPDKFKDPVKKKKAEKRFQRLSLVVSILRDHAKKQRYDYYLKRGFPTYNPQTQRYEFGHKFRPSFLLTLFIILVLASVLQYIVLRINNAQKFKRASQLIEDVRNNAVRGGVPTGPKVVLYNDRLFVVKPDLSVWFYDGPVETDDDQKEAAQRIRDKFAAEAAQANVKENRKQRRAKKKGKNGNGAAVEGEDHDNYNDSDNDIPLLPVTADEVDPVQLSQLFIVRVLTFPYTYIKSSLASDSPSSPSKKAVNLTPEEVEVLGKETKETMKEDTSEVLRLPNGKVVRRRK